MRIDFGIFCCTFLTFFDTQHSHSKSTESLAKLTIVQLHCAVDRPNNLSCIFFS